MSSSEPEQTWSPFSFPGAGEAERPTGPAGGATATVAPWVIPEVEPGPDAANGPAAQVEEDDPYARGREDGQRDGYARRSREVQHAMEALRQAAEEIQGQRTEQARQLGHYVHTLAVAVAQQVVQREVTQDPAIVRGLVERALDLIPVTAPIEVHMNVEDLESLRPEVEAITRGDRGEAIQWLPSPALSRGSFVIESQLQVVNGTLDVALRTLYERLVYD